MRKSIKIASKMERADILLSYLEKLKERVTVIENQYNFSNHNYTRVCEEAIVKISNLRTDLEKDDEKPGKPGSDVREINNLEARFKLGLVAPETYQKYRAKFEDKVEPRRSNLQAAIDNMANAIEFVLDKIGDGIIFPFVKIAEGYNLLISKFSRS